MLGAQGLQADRDFYCATTSVIRGLGFSCFTGRTGLFSRLLRHRREFGESIPAWILTGFHSVSKGVLKIYFTRILKDHFDMEKIYYQNDHTIPIYKRLKGIDTKGVV
jgi:hypothetical protein